MSRFATITSACLSASILALALQLIGCSVSSGGGTTDSNMNANDNGPGDSTDNANDNGDASGNANANDNGDASGNANANDNGDASGNANVNDNGDDVTNDTDNSNGNTNGNANDNGASEACSSDSDCPESETCTDGQCVPDGANDATGTITIEIYTDRSSFEARLGGSVSVVDFDDINASTQDFVAFNSDRYKDSLGIVITGTDGQYASESFGFPEDYVPSSPPNMYAPGPMTDDSSGGHETEVTFIVGGEAAVVAGFGAVFIDTDFPDFGPSGISVFGENGVKWAEEEGFLGGEGEGLFRGMVAVAENGEPTPAIFRVELINGNSWAATTSTCCEGVTLDDFVFSLPSAPPSAQRGINNPRARR